MSTRGLIGFVAEGKLSVTYNHSDSYPEWLGLNVLGFVAQLVKEGPDAIASARARAAQITVVADEESEPTAEAVAALDAWADRRVDQAHPSGKPSWYQLLRKTHGNPDAILTAGYLVDSFDFGLDSLFCEWGYVIDFDQRVIEIYRGFQQSPPSRGRWAKAKPDSASAERRVAAGVGTYYPIALITAFSFNALPDVETFTERVYAADNTRDGD